MLNRKEKFPPLLRKRIDPREAVPNGLAIQLGAPASEKDVARHIIESERQRWPHMDKYFGLDSTDNNLWEQRVKALVQYSFDIPPNDSKWWSALATAMARQLVPGFTLIHPDKRGGAPVKWTYEKLAQLFADVEFKKKNKSGSVRKICSDLCKTEIYRKRWGGEKADTLRKAYRTAKKLAGDSTMSAIAFRFELFHEEAAKGGQNIDTAIERHALKPVVAKIT